MSDGKIIDGKAFASGLKEKIRDDAAKLVEKTGKKPGLAVVLVGDDPASKVYVSNKIKTTEELGLNSFATFLPGDTSEEDLLKLVRQLNEDDTVHGILVQFPVPDQISQQTVINTISPDKDVDGLHPVSAGRLSSGLKGLVSCTPLGCSMLIKDRLGQDLSGLHAVIIGRSNLVGKPVAQLLLGANATVTMAHSRTKDLPQLCAEADILVAAVGRPEMVKADWVKEGACVIDVGINRIPAPDKGEGKTRLVGDVDYEACFERAGSITPVPGGVGPMTIACLLHNTLEAYKAIEGVEL